ncbi:MAG: GWxTD domain-containing protein [candidate division KSB1 bacterium]|nr:GWxTD domain-containing protein [candidate division KSB1 bacterium]
MQNRRIVQSALVMVIVLSRLAGLHGQIDGKQMPVATSQAREMFGPPPFLYDSHYFLEDSIGTSFHYRLDVTVAFANDILQFVKERQSHFTASYDLAVRILDHKGNLVVEQNVGDQITVPDFKSTNDRELSNRHQMNFRLHPGRYKLSLDLTDRDTQKTLHREQELILPKPDRSKVTLSEIVFADQVIADSSDHIRQFSPNLTRHFSDSQKELWAYFEIYPASMGGELKLSYLIRNANDQKVAEHQRSLSSDRMVVPILIDLKEHIKTSGRFMLEVKVEQQNLHDRTQARFSMRWSNDEPSSLNLQTKIETLKEYVSEKEFKNLLQSPDSLKSAWLKAFWKQRDPTPETEYNELQQEFYRRVEFANNVFTINVLDKEGWKTDRGAVYIKYGPPTEVERHQEQLNVLPYEIWYYSKLDQRFFFQDKTGMGDFQLIRIE